VVNGHPLSSDGYASYELTILLPKQRPRLALEVPDVYASYNLYVNGELMAQNGHPDSSAVTARPFWTTQDIALTTKADTLHLILQVANFWHSKGGTYKEIVIGQRDQIILQHHRDLAGCLFMGGLFFFGLFVFGKRDKALLYFSLFCIVYSYRMIGTDLYVLHSVMPALSWFVTIRLEYLTLTTAVALFARYIRHLYPEDAPKIAMRWITWFCIVYALIILATAPVVFTGLLNIFLVVMFLFIAFAFYICFRAVRFKRAGATFALLSCAVMLFVFFTINLHYFGFISATKWFVFAGYILFFFLQSLVLSHRFASTLQRAASEAKQGLKAKSEFLSTMSHEIRTPLNVVIGMAHLMLRDNPRKDQEKNLNVLLFSANNLLSIVNDILDYNKIEAGKINFEAVPMDIASIAGNIVGGLHNKASEKNIGLRLETDSRLTQKIIGDPTRMSQVINNLVQNAVKFTEKGSVVLAIKADQISNEATTLTISVTDTGIGIAPEKQQLIFERFTQADSSTSRSYGGTGLGLTITKGILALQHVKLQIQSEPGKGSVFYFTQSFPLSTEAASNDSGLISINQTEKQLTGMSILVVEDNPFNVMVAQSLLERNGAHVEVATNGKEALEKVQPGRYQLILMDLNMPEMDGFEATRELRKRGESMPIIALTANVPAEVEKDVRAAGLTDILVKPFNPDDLFRMILPYLLPSAV
jgi:signal transduction histidine kinase